jgi:hypothetical protein
MGEQKQLKDMTDLELKGIWFDQIQILEQIKLNLEEVRKEMIERKTPK